MYSANNKEHIYVVTYKEFVFAMIVFVLVLVALYPKEILKDQILSNDSNYALDIIYLKDLMQHHPDDAYLKYIYAEKNLKMGNIQETLSTLGQISMVHDAQLHTKVLLLLYEAQKMYYFTLKNKHKRTTLRAQMRDIFDEIYRKKLYDNNDEKWYKEAIFVQNKTAAYYFLKRFLHTSPKHPNYLKDAYYLSMELGYQGDSEHFLNLLERYSTQGDRLYWAKKRYEMLLRYKKYTAAEELLIRYAKESLPMKKELARFYLQTQQYQKASDTYLSLYKEVHSDAYLKKAISTLQEGNLLSEAAALTQQYEKFYIQDPDMRDFFLQVYLSAGKLQKAADFSRKILRVEHGL